MTVRLMPLRTTEQRHPEAEQVDYAVSQAINTVRWIPREANLADTDAFGFSDTVPAKRIIEQRPMNHVQYERHSLGYYVVGAVLALVGIGAAIMTPFVRFAVWAGDAIHRRFS